MANSLKNFFKKIKAKCNECNYIWTAIIPKNNDHPFCPMCSSKNTEIIPENIEEE